MRASLRFASPLVLLLGSCVAGGEASGPSLDLYDPYGLMDVVGELRLLVFRADAYGCTADGTVTPEISDAPEGPFEDAVVNITLPVGESRQLTLDEGTYVVHVRGRGTDPVSGRTNVIVATGCTPNVNIVGGETSEITVEIQDVVGTGVCDDGILSPDEQCENATGPLPCVACQTQAVVAHTTTDNVQDKPSVAWASGQRLVLAFDSAASTPRGVRTMFRSEEGQAITSPAALAIDLDVDDGMTIPGVQTTTATALSAARVAIAFGDFRDASTMGGDVLVRFFDRDRVPAGNATLAVPQAGAQTNAALAMLADGTTLAVFEDGASSSGASAVRFAAGSTTPDAAVAIGSAGVTAPAVAATSDGFVVAFASAGDVFVQRFGADGAATDATPIAVVEGADAGGTQDQPTVAALADGRFFVAFRDEGMGAVRGRAFASSGSPAAVVTLGPGANPSAAAGAERFFVAWDASGTVRARIYDGTGAPARNRESPPTPDAFTVGSGTEPVVAVGGPSGRVLAFVGFVSGGDVQGRLYPLP